ncbi:hypothetical protein K4A83_14425 [Spirulina subsalsa FACHB-351]|jgi:hypothetical protein|uniref:Protein NO VEIN C-terminal domain-containing protein n=1 Tax=Spirulina subsalsa FACHB-351 TaxID=234711 RepID=A0ABT3L7I3_9CYAN|nr:hypothetical protein [Spirulina subsalsa FACHB-351]
MKAFSDPTLFSKHFDIDPEELSKAGLIDPFLDVDTQLFIDPILLEKCAIPLISGEAHAALRSHFGNVFRLLTISTKEGDAPWKAAQRLLELTEAPFNGLGYGKGDRDGTSRPDELRDTILRTSKEVVQLGEADPEMISLMGFFEENVGPDTISDLTSRIIFPQLAQITRGFCLAHKIPVRKSDASPNFALPHFKGQSGRMRAMVLVPRDIVRDLPMARDWSEVFAATQENKAIRNRVNEFLASIARPTVADRKAALRRAAMQSDEAMNEFVRAMKEAAKYYDPAQDILGYYKLRQILNSDLNEFLSHNRFDGSKGPREIKRIVMETIDMFKHHVEKGNLWEELWVDGKPKKERAAQLIYYAIADCYCRANNVDISPEAHMGGGPIDFKYSVGYNARVLVEMKRSGGQVVHGYEKQLEIYKDAARTNYGVFVVIDYGDGLRPKLNAIRKIQKAREDLDEEASEIIVIDASPKASASKRK